jgi:SAM-dependent methyltransferase
VKWLIYRLLNRGLNRFGFVVVPKRELTAIDRETGRLQFFKRDIIRANETGSSGGLRRHLLETNRTRWLEIGCGGNLVDKEFYYVDIFPEGVVDREFRPRYWRLDIANAFGEQLNALGTYDFIRMQHVFEHFAPEEGRKVLENCARLLNPNGYLLITTPDLRTHAEAYVRGYYKDDPEMMPFRQAASKRIPATAPDSFLFSVFAHSLPYERHLWCYDVEGLTYQLSQTGAFEDIQEIGWGHALASVPFTHNRPHEDACVLARRSAAKQP